MEVSKMTFVVIEFGQSLMGASPHGPRQPVQRSKRERPDQIPEEPTDFWNGKRHHHRQRRPRLCLNWLNELAGGLDAGLSSLISRFFPSTSPWLWTRTTVRKACARSARVTCLLFGIEAQRTIPNNMHYSDCDGGAFRIMTIPAMPGPHLIVG
jgi:hypothetical protein